MIKKIERDYLELAETFPERLLITRRKRRLTQQALADKIGTHKTNICKYERGYQLPPVIHIIRIADALNVSVDFLLERDRWSV